MVDSSFVTITPYKLFRERLTPMNYKLSRLFLSKWFAEDFLINSIYIPSVSNETNVKIAPLSQALVQAFYLYCICFQAFPSSNPMCHCVNTSRREKKVYSRRSTQNFSIWKIFDDNEKCRRTSAKALLLTGTTSRDGETVASVIQNYCLPFHNC